ncbi:hypothetical protein MKX03_022277 [Papaver bracteatum]|nr:hypothetical protein MKX03_022277 [Papaver bracteatum]
MVGTFSGLQDHLRLDREYANEGLYDTSIIFFYVASGRGGKATNIARSIGAGVRSSVASGTSGNKAAGSSKSNSGKSESGYEGPDPELAAMLERDVLETSPGVRWDDEAVVLPLWMHEYFQVDGVNASTPGDDGACIIVMVLAATNFPWHIDKALRFAII